MIRINSQAIYKISKKLSNVNNFLYGWELMNKSVKPCITNRLEKGGIPSAHQVLLKMILNAHVIDMPPPPPKGNVPRECRIFVTKLHGAGPKAAKFDIRETKFFFSNCGNPVCGNHVVPICKKCNIATSFIL